MGAVQRLATVVILGLVAVAGILVLYIADESNRLDSTAASQQHDAVERATQTYLTQCLACHGPAGEGYTAPGEAGTGRIGAPIGGDTFATSLNQTGLTADGLPWSDPNNPQYGSGLEGRANFIRERIHTGRRAADGTYLMPPFGAELNGPLNDAQIDELVVFIQHVDWNHVYNQAIEANGGYPTPPAAAVAEAETPTAAAGGDGGQAAGFEIDMVDLAFEPTELTIPANTDVTISLVNKGSLPHIFQLSDGSVTSEEIPGGGTGSVTLNLPPGEYDFHCPVPGHTEAGMVGKLIVEEGAPMPDGGEAPAAEASPETTGGESAAPSSVDLVMVDLSFDPTELTIPANTDVTINLVNNGALPHQFALLDGSVTSDEIPGGGTGSVVVNLPPGEYDFHCPVPGHTEAGMVGKLIVTEQAAGGETTGGEDVAPAADGGEATAPIDLVMVDLAFEPTEITIPANTDVTINLTNNGALPHIFALSDGSVTSDEIPGGGTGSVVLNLPPGEYDFHCPVPGHTEAGMVGKLIVTQDAGAATGDGGAAPAADSGAGAAATSEIVMVDLAFEPTELTIAANTDVTINLVNNGALPHQFALTDGSITSDEIAGGASGSVVVNLPPGEYEFHCPIPGHTEAGMTGKLIVQ